jgi:adenosylhomocysteine nucleosidase
MKISIITAMPEETRAVLGKTWPVEKAMHGDHSTYRCLVAGHDIILFEAGMGMPNAGWAASVLAADMPDLIVSAGFGGGVVPGLKVGDVVMAERVLHWTGAGFEQVQTRFYGQNPGDSASLLPRSCFITCDGIINKQRLIELLPSGVNLPVVEMESAAVARVAAERGIPFMGLRAISDSWNEELGFSIEEFCDDAMRIRPFKVAATLLRRPRIIPQLIRLAWNSHVAAKGLGAAIERLLESVM